MQNMTVDQLIANFEILEDWEDRYTYLIDLGRKMPPLDEAEKIEENRVKGCQATVWLKEIRSDSDPVRLEFQADSNSSIVKGLVSVLLLLFSGKTPEEIIALDPRETLARLELESHLSPTRKNGLHAMTVRIKELAQEALLESSART